MIEWNVNNTPGATPLLVASLAGHFKVVDMLLAYGADPNKADTYLGYTPLHVACGSKGNVDKPVIVEMLLSAGADIDKGDKFGVTALSYAALSGHEHGRLVKLILYYGANYTEYNSLGNLPIGYAIAGGDTEVRFALLS